MKRILCCMLSFLLLLSFFAVGSHAATIVDSGKCGANVTYTLDSDGLLTISGTGPMWDFAGYYLQGNPDNSPIPWVYQAGEFLVSDVGNVVIQNGVTSIGDFAFAYCSDIISISIPGSVSNIGDYAFSECSLLRNLLIPNSVSSIGKRAFDYSGIRTIALPNNPDYTCINEGLFNSCENLTSVTIPSSVTEIMAYAFEGCKKLKSISLPAGLEKIGEFAFAGCTLLESVNLPDELTEIGASAFKYCNALTFVTIPGSVKTVPYRAFYGCDSLTNVTLSRGVWHIDDQAFSSCISLANITLPDTLRTIGSSAFSSCSKLKKITIPENVASMYSDSLPSTTIIYGMAGSYAEEWATENKRTFVAIETPVAPPVITTQPQNISAKEGEIAGFAVVAAGEGLTYAWYYKDPGQTSFSKSASTANSVKYNATADRNGRQVYCVVMDQNGNSTQTNVVTMTVTPALKITTQPANQTVAAGTNATFSVTAAGDGVTYAWYYKDTGATAFSKSASTNSSVIYTTSAARNGRQVYCLVTDKYGNTAKSNTVTLTVTSAGPQITAQPKSVTVAAGTNATFSVTATGEGLTYAWYYKDTGASAFSKSASTNSSVIYTTSVARNGRQVYCVIMDSEGNTVKSDTVTLTVTSGPKITAQPKAATVAVGTNATFSVTATGTALSYAWYYKDPGATSFSKSASTNSSVIYTTSAARNGRQVYCVVTDSSGNSVKSNTVTLTVTGVGPAITKQPTNQTAAAGAAATFSLTAAGVDLTYAWYYKDPGQTKFTKSASAANSVIYNATVARNGRQVYCVVMDGEGNTAKSNTVTMTVK